MAGIVFSLTIQSAQVCPMRTTFYNPDHCLLPSVTVPKTVALDGISAEETSAYRYFEKKPLAQKNYKYPAYYEFLSDVVT